MPSGTRVGSIREIWADGVLGHIRWFFYRRAMNLAHRFNWHYAPPIHPDGDTQLWCKWCGFRQTIKRRGSSIWIAARPTGRTERRQ